MTKLPFESRDANDNSFDRTFNIHEPGSQTLVVKRQIRP